MSRTNKIEAEDRSPRYAPEDEDLDEACFLAELRLSVEGARTPAEERLARSYPGLSERLGLVCAKLAN